MDFFDERFVPAFNPQLCRGMLHRMCDYLDDAMSDPIGVELLAAGGTNVWVLGFMGFRVSAELQLITMLANQGGMPKDVDAEFNLARPFETIKPLQMMVECLFPALLPDDVTDVPPPNREYLRDWLAKAAMTLLKRDPAFRRLITQTLPIALRLPEPIHKLCLTTRERPRGPGLDSHHALTVLEYQDELTATARENPKLLPLLTAYIDAAHPKFDWHGPVHQLKSAVLKAGHSQAAWRYVCRYGARLFKVAWSLTPTQPAFEVALRYLAAIEAAGLPPPPPPSVATAWLKAFNVNHFFDIDIDVGENFHKQMEPKILGLALTEAHLRRNDPKLNEFIPEFLGVCWWSRQTNAKLDKNQIHAGWPWIINQWKAEQSLQEVLAAANSITWKMQLAEMSLGPWRVVPLNSSEALTRESFAMRNCLRDYIVRCAAGVEEYYSIRDRTTGKRKACVGFRFDEAGSGNLSDMKGFANSKPRWEFENLAIQLQLLVNLTAKPKLSNPASAAVSEGPGTIDHEVVVNPISIPQPIADDAAGGAIKNYVVKVDDNFHYMDEDARWTMGEFANLEAAIDACKRLVDQCLEEYFVPGISAETLLSQYKNFGDDPFIVCAEGGVKFSAWDYAAQRCQRMTDLGDCK